MVLHHPHHPALATLRKLGVVTLAAAAMVTGTAAMMAVMQGQNTNQLVAADGQPTTASEVIMKSATERALVSPRAMVLAVNMESNEGRGF